MKFQYLDAREEEILGLVKGTRGCGICGSENRCFSLKRAFLASGVPEAELGCVDCLRAGRFGFCHDTVVGFLDQHDLMWELDDEPMTPGRVFVGGAGGAVSEVAQVPEPLPRPQVSQASLEGLRRTPRFSTWNEVPWHVHCSDFMVYLGTWQPPEVQSLGEKQGLTAQAAFVDMVDLDYRDMWLEGAQEFGFAFHVFRCSSCTKHVGFPDFD